jgi:hypothetical protein
LCRHQLQPLQQQQQQQGVMQWVCWHVLWTNTSLCPGYLVHLALGRAHPRGLLPNLHSPQCRHSSSSNIHSSSSNSSSSIHSSSNSSNGSSHGSSSSRLASVMRS